MKPLTTCLRSNCEEARPLLKIQLDSKYGYLSRIGPMNPLLWLKYITISCYFQVFDSFHNSLPIVEKN